MQKRNATLLLKDNIRFLENKQAVEWEMLKTQARITQASLTPLNLIKTVLGGTSRPADEKTEFLDTGIGMVAGYVAKQVLRGVSHNPLLNVAGTLLQIGVTNVITRHPGVIKLLGTGIFKRFFNKPKD